MACDQVVVPSGIDFWQEGGTDFELGVLFEALQTAGAGHGGGRQAVEEVSADIFGVVGPLVLEDAVLVELPSAHAVFFLDADGEVRVAVMTAVLPNHALEQPGHIAGAVGVGKGHQLGVGRIGGDGGGGGGIWGGLGHDGQFHQFGCPFG